MKLKSMKLDKSDREETKAGPIDASDQPAYPWGLQVRLDEQSLDKLGLDTLPKVDGELMLIAKVRVVAVSSNEHSKGGEGKTHKHKSVELQITAMALDDVPAEKDASDELYAKKG
jgi:hypothetical protein